MNNPHNPNGHDPSGQHPNGRGHLRIGATDRDIAVEMLGQHVAAGRLTMDEYDNRVRAALRAQTGAELQPLFRDLPPPHPPILLPAAVPPGRTWQWPAALSEEGLLILEENLRGTTTYHQYRAPGRYSSWKKEPLRASVAVTQRRLAMWSGRTKHVDVPADHPARAAVTVVAEKPDRLRIDVDTAAFHSDRSGQIVWRLRTPRAGYIADLARPR